MREGSRKLRGIAKEEIGKGCALAFAHEIHTANHD